jgi:hypothetical protein
MVYERRHRKEKSLVTSPKAGLRRKGVAREPCATALYGGASRHTPFSMRMSGAFFAMLPEKV